MAVAAVPGVSSSDAVLQTLKWTRKQGFKPVPLRKQSKAAIIENYTSLEYVPPGDEMWMQRDLGVGVLLGPKNAGPVDVDLDCPEAIFFATRFLPPTPAVFGRPSKPSSHYLYRPEVDEYPKKAFLDPIQKSTIIEARGDGGHQTVFPGSLHEDTGEAIVWASTPFPDVPKVDAAFLENSIKKIAIATLITRHMWAEGQRNEVCKHLAGIFYYLDWNEEETKSLITAVMDYVGDTDKTRLRTVAQTYKKGEKGGKITGSNTLKSILGDARLVDKILEWAGSENASVLQEYNERYAVVAIEGKFRIAETIGVERGGIPTLYGKEDFLNMMATDNVSMDGKPVNKAKMWLANPRRRTYRAMDFLPGVEDSSPLLNLWSGWAVDPDPNASCSAWLDLLHYTICGGDSELYNWMLQWFANILREPQSKPMTAPVLIGPQGAGKSLLVRYFGRILGSSYVTVTNEEHIYGRFNKHLSTCLLLHSEEALYGGDRKHRGIIKSLITDEYRVFEPKGVDAKMIKNHLRMILTSNEIHAAPTEIDDRRFTILNLADRKAKQELINEVLQELEHNGPGGLFYYLMDMKYDPVLPRTNVKNDQLLTLKKINFDPMTSWWYEVLKTGQLLPDYLSWAQKPARAEWPAEVACRALYLSMLFHLRERSHRYVPDPTAQMTFFTKMVGDIPKKQQYYTNPMADNVPREVRVMSNKQYSCEAMPSLDDCRAMFEIRIGQRLEWPQDAKPEDVPVHVEY